MVNLRKEGVFVCVYVYVCVSLVRMRVSGVWMLEMARDIKVNLRKEGVFLHMCHTSVHIYIQKHVCIAPRILDNLRDKCVFDVHVCIRAHLCVRHQVSWTIFVGKVC